MWVEASDGNQVEVKGYAYLSKEGKWVLAEKPDVKSCCVGRLIDEQIFLIGDCEHLKNNQAVKVKGTFHCSPGSIQKYTLSDISFEPRETKIPYVTVAFVVAIFLVARWFRRKKA